MFLSDRDLEFAVKTKQLIVSPPPTEYDTTSIDLHLDRIETAKVWNVAAFEDQQKTSGSDPWLRVGGFRHETFAKQFHLPIPEDTSQPVFRDGTKVILKPHGFFVWQTAEAVGTPEEDSRLMCFLDGKSTRARVGLLVHMTAPNIHAGWWGQITLEISNLGPFTLALKQGDAVCQIVVATISSPPVKRKSTKGVRMGQNSPAGEAGTSSPS
jgi:dCTP deaminase